MKKMVLIVAAFTYALTGCASMWPDKENATTSTDDLQTTVVEQKNEAAEELVPTDVKKFFVAQVDGNTVELSAENSETIRQFLCDDDWIPDATKCDSDYIVTFDGRTIFYHSDCGTFNERLEESNRSFRLFETDRKTINAIIQSVFPID